MTAYGDLIGGRYRVEREDRALGGLRRVVATDTRLDRPVLAWVSGAAGPAEDALLETARAVGEFGAAPFLRVLDVASDAAGLAVIIEAPGTPLARTRGPVPIDVRSSAALLEAIDRALGETPLRIGRVAASDVFVEAGEPVVDPIALFFPALPGEPRATADDLVALLVDRARDGETLALALRPMVRPAARRAASAARPAVAATYVDDDPTVVFTPRAATAVADRPPSIPPAVPLVEVPASPEPGPVEQSLQLEEVASAAPRRGPLPWRVFVPLYGALAVVVAAVLVFALRSPSTNPPATPTAAPNQAAGAPAVAPAAGHVTVGLAATEDSGVRVTVDGIVQFDGTLKSGQRQTWDGKQRIDVWTDKGKTLQLAVNGKDLGAYSPAMGHADWNRIDFSFWPGFGQ